MKNYLQKLTKLLMPGFHLMLIILLFPLLCAAVLIAKLKIKLIKQKDNVALGPTGIVNNFYFSHALDTQNIKNSTISFNTFSQFDSFKFDYDFTWIIKPISYPFMPFFYVLIFIWVIFNFNIFIIDYCGGYLQNTILKYVEFKILKFLNKKIIVYAYGADAFDYNLKNPYDKYNLKERYIRDYPYMKKIKNYHKVKYISSYADFIITLYSFLWPSKDYYNIAKIIFCINTKKIIPFYPPRTKKTNILIIHAPNHRWQKGTDIIIKAVKNLKKKGFSIKLQLIEKMENIKALEMYQKADIIIDQIILGSYALFAIEAMAMGKPVMCYICDEDIKRIPLLKKCPIINTNPDKIEKDLIKLIKFPYLRYEIGKKSRKYVEKYHSFKHIGKFFKKIINEL